MAAESKWEAKLRKMKSGWANSKQSYKEMFGASDIPEDVYVAKLQDTELTESNAGKLRIKREHVILEGDHKGVVVRDGLNLENEYGPVFCRRWFALLGVDIPEEPEELEEVLGEVKDAAPVCKIRVRHSGDFTNVDVISVVDEDGGSGEGGEGEDVDLDSLDKTELRALVKENDLDIADWRKMDEDTLRDTIRGVLSEEDVESESEGEGEGEEDAEGIDLDALDKAGLLEVIIDNEIDPKDLGFKNKSLMKKATEDKLRSALTEYMGAEGEGKEDESEGKSDVDDELLEQAKVFCGTWDVEVAEDADLDGIKTAMAECKFPEKELDEDEIVLLGALELTDCIQKPVA